MAKKMDSGKDDIVGGKMNGKMQANTCVHLYYV